MDSNRTDKTDMERQLAELLHGAQALVLATVNEEGMAEASYAPYVEFDGRYFIFISGLASHTSNLKRSGKAGVLFMDADDGGHPHTRKRLSCQCKASAISRDNALFDAVMHLMEERFGSLIGTLRGLGDFRLFQLEPVKGNFVAGFGRAFDVEFPVGGRIRHRRPD